MVMPENSSAEGRPEKQRLRVLLVEDEADLKSAIQEVFLTRGFSVDTASTGSEALRCFLGREYQVVVSDIQLPKIDGVELARLLSRRVHSPRIVLMTASSDPDMVRQGYAAGATHVLSKPFSLTSLARMVEELGA